ncbi:unnamed protein product [Calypogeia fissa]
MDAEDWMWIAHVEQVISWVAESVDRVQKRSLEFSQWIVKQHKQRRLEQAKEDQERAEEWQRQQDEKDRFLAHSTAKKAREISEMESHFIPVLPDRVAFEEMMKQKPTQAQKEEWMKKNTIEVEKAAYIEAHQRKEDYDRDVVDNKQK